MNKIFENCTAKDVIEHFDTNDLLVEMDEYDIANFINDNWHILNTVNDALLADSINDQCELSGILDSDFMIEELKDRGYDIRRKEDNTCQKIKNLCRELQPKGYIGKEEAKKILCDYIDFWMNKSF